MCSRNSRIPTLIAGIERPCVHTSVLLWAATTEHTQRPRQGTSSTAELFVTAGLRRSLRPVRCQLWRRRKKGRRELPPTAHHRLSHGCGLDFERHTELWGRDCHQIHLKERSLGNNEIGEEFRNSRFPGLTRTMDNALETERQVRR